MTHIGETVAVVRVEPLVLAADAAPVEEAPVLEPAVEVGTGRPVTT